MTLSYETDLYRRLRAELDQVLLLDSHEDLQRETELPVGGCRPHRALFCSLRELRSRDRPRRGARRLSRRRGVRSCLLLGAGQDGRRIHVVCAPREDYLAVITAYLPDAGEWSDDFRTRVKN